MDEGRIHEDTFWKYVDDAVDAFSRSQEKRWPADLDSFLPDIDGPTKRQVLIELMKIDFERGWRVESSRSVDTYIQDWSWIEQDSPSVFELVRWEIELRADAGESVEILSWIRRFPGVEARLRGFDVPVCRNGSSGEEEFSFTVSTPLLKSITGQKALQTKWGRYRALPRGHMLGRYCIQSVLGRGGMGVVYLCEDVDLNRLVAVKVLHPWIIGPASDQSLLKQEARIAAQVRHTSIVPIYDFGTAEDGAQFIVMEYVDGQSLAQYLKDHQPIPIEDALEIVAQIAEGLHAAHSSGFVHRDIKPANILIDQKGRAHLTDFGLAVSHRQRGKGDQSGTIPYMAPEQFSSHSDMDEDNRPADIASDLWALGVVLYELLTGNRPFRGEDASSIELSILNDSPPPPDILRPGIPRWLNQLYRACLSKDPAERPNSAAELAARLRAGAKPSGVTNSLPRLLIPVAVLLVLVLSIVYVRSPWITGSNGGHSDDIRQDPNSRTPGSLETASVDDGICPWLRDNCKLVLSVNTGEPIDLFDELETVDRSQLFTMLESDIVKNKFWQNSEFFLVSPQVNETAEPFPDWMTWTMDAVPFYNRFSQKSHLPKDIVRFDSVLLPREDLGLKLRFAVHRDGRIQIGTTGIEGYDHVHLLALANTVSGMTNFMMPDGEMMNRTEIDRPLDGNIQFDARSTCLAEFAAAVYRVLVGLQSQFDPAANPKPPPDIYGFHYELKNYFDRPVTIVDQRLFFQLARDMENTARRQSQLTGPMVDTSVDVARMSNHSAFPMEPRSAIYEKTDMAFWARDFNDGDPSRDTWNCRHDDDHREFAYHRISTRYRLPKVSAGRASVLTIGVGSDNRNSTRVTVRGLDPIHRDDEPDNGRRGTPEEWNARGTSGPSPDDISRSEIHIDRVNRELELTEWNIAGAHAILFNRQFDLIDIEAIQQWSVVRPAYRFVYLGDWSDEMVESSEAVAEIRYVKPFDPRYPTPKQHQLLSAEWDLLDQPHSVTAGPKPFPPRILTIPPSRKKRGQVHFRRLIEQDR